MKPIQTKPMLYAHYLGLLQERARQMGYNLLLHGSLARDCDLVAVPWTYSPADHFELIAELDYILTGYRGCVSREYNYSVLPGGRHSYVINLNRGGYAGEQYQEDPQFYLDISVTPLAHTPNERTA